ncbi:hypothetical protein SIN8267_01221 [Sinobacterium norvegicum]|uniref:HTH araC/xylS-type domain-containing protein n=1 Tax=Sinobacterium norvegicum TaxID=1641715 RepID=A0ABM9AD50_9GAMM|nr:helix-turn-helix domain-containing protein [Sinobacterium norvegicum]CAH0991120.1 hypothetical protein SIN8267_01221 [Sinobacterium norvegicum]
MARNNLLAANSDHLVPLATTAIASEIIPLLQKNGHDIYAIAESANFPLTILEFQHSHCSEKTWTQLLAAVSLHNGSEGVKTILQQLCQELLIPRYLPGSAQPLRSVIDKAFAITNASSANSKVECRHIAGRVFLVQERRYNSDCQPPHAEQAIIQYMTEIICVLTHRDWRPSRIALQSASVTDDFRHYFSHSTLYLKRRLTAIDITDIDNISNVEFLGGSTADCHQSHRRESFSENFKLVLKPYISSGRLAIDDAARLLGIGARTLQRRLRYEGTSYRKIIDDIMLDHIILLMKNPNKSLTEIGFIMGYSDPAHFSRAFKKITGVSPRCYRKNIASGKENTKLHAATTPP